MKYITKAILNTEEVSDLGLDWARSQRTILNVDHDYLIIGNKRIEFSQIETSKIRIIPSAYFIPSVVLTIKVNGKNSHLGLSYSKKILKEFPFVEKIEKAPNPPTLWVRRIFNICLLGLVVFSLIYRTIL